MICDGTLYGVRPFVACLPAWFRFAQCLRRYKDTRHAFPHLVNAGKYSTSFFVVAFSTLGKGILYISYQGHTGKHWPEVVSVRTELSEVFTKSTKEQYSPVHFEQAILVNS